MLIWSKCFRRLKIVVSTRCWSSLSSRGLSPGHDPISKRRLVISRFLGSPLLRIARWLTAWILSSWGHGTSNPHVFTEASTVSEKTRDRYVCFLQYIPCHRPCFKQFYMKGNSSKPSFSIVAKGYDWRQLGIVGVTPLQLWSRIV